MSPHWGVKWVPRALPVGLHKIIARLYPQDHTLSIQTCKIYGLTFRGFIWQSGFYDYILDSEEKVLTRIRYIENNPVRKGMVSQPEDYAYSSIKEREATDFSKFF